MSRRNRTGPEQTRDLIYGMLETTLGGMVCALDEDQVGEFVPALHNISAQYHVDRAHSRRLVSVSIPPALNVSPRGLAKVHEGRSL